MKIAFVHVYTSVFLVGLIHGDMHQEERNSVINAFKKQEVPIMVATDVAGKHDYHLLSFS